MNSTFTRRQVLGAAAAVPAAVAMSRLPSALAADPKATGGFSFAFVGDIHFDKLEHHDMAWMEKEMPGDIRQVKNYSRIAAEVLPQLMTEVQGHTTANKSPFVLQVGDVVEGLCGTPELAVRHTTDALQFVDASKLGAPLLFCKGNHDITGPGAREAYSSVFHPYLTTNLKTITGKEVQPLNRAFYSFEHGNALFAFFDAYEDASLPWLETVLAASKATHKFVIIHTPVVPYGARSTWHVYSKQREAEKRTRLLETLGKNRAIVLSGHIHKYNVLARRTESGQFVQVAIGSVIPRPEIKPADILEGVAAYTPDQIKVEPNFSPTTEAARRAALEAEVPHIRAFEYAEAPGYTVLHVNQKSVTVDIYNGLGKQLWKTHDLTALLTT